MSTSPDHVVNVLSHWLARHVGNDDLLRAIEELDAASLSNDQREAVEDLRAELRGAHDRGELEMAVRETLESLALG